MEIIKHLKTYALTPKGTIWHEINCDFHTRVIDFFMMNKSNFEITWSTMNEFDNNL